MEVDTPAAEQLVLDCLPFEQLMNPRHSSKSLGSAHMVSLAKRGSSERELLHNATSRDHPTVKVETRNYWRYGARSKRSSGRSSGGVRSSD